MCLTLAHGDVYSIQHYAIKFICGLSQVSDFPQGTLVSSANKTGTHDIAEILLKVALNNIAQFVQSKTPNLI